MGRLGRPPRTLQVDIDGAVARIHLADLSSVALIDVEDLPRVGGRGWHVMNGYAASNLGLMHRVILDLPARFPHVDHVNGDRLDNRRANLRVATERQNARNAGVKSSNTTGFKGVSRETKTQRFVAFIWTDARKIRLGTFDTAEDAARAYDAAAIRYHGEFARTNANLGLL